MLLVTLFILGQPVRTLDVMVCIDMQTLKLRELFFFMGRCVQRYDVMLTCELIFIHVIILYRPWNY